MEDPNDAWVQHARCKDKETNTFFILRGDPEQRQKRVAAYTGCGMCPVRVECLDYAIVNHEVGIWGGTSDAERRLMRRSQTWVPLSKPRRRVLWYNPHV